MNDNRLSEKGLCPSYKRRGQAEKSLVLVELSKCVPANHSEEMKNMEGKKVNDTLFKV